MRNKYLKEQKRHLEELFQEDFKDANANFVEILKTNILVATVVFSFLGSYLVSEPYFDDFIQLITILIIIFFALSVLFGLIQFIINYSHSRDWGIFRQSMANEIVKKGMSDERWWEYYMDERKNSGLDSESKIWPLYCQMGSGCMGLLWLILFLGVLLFSI